MRSFDLHAGSLGPPLMHAMQNVKEGKNAVGFNTPGAASSAADLEAQDPPKSRPKPEKIDVEKQYVFSIDFKGFGCRFGKVFGRFFGAKKHAKSDLKKSVRHARNIAWAYEF